DGDLHVDATVAEALRVGAYGRVVAAAEGSRAALAAAAAPGDKQSGGAHRQRGSSRQRRVTHGHCWHNRTLVHQRVTNARTNHLPALLRVIPEGDGRGIAAKARRARREPWAWPRRGERACHRGRGPETRRAEAPAGRVRRRA